LFNWARKAAAKAFGYDAIQNNGKRRNVGSRVVREDALITGPRRNALQENASDLTRNFAILNWMVNTHANHVAPHTFHARTSDEGLNNVIEALMEFDGRAENADVSGCFGREELFRLAEVRRLIDGDTFLVKLSDGRLQAIQADLIQNPEDAKPNEQWINGVLTSQLGRPLAYGVRVRDGLTGSKADRRVNATDMIQYGFFSRYAADQIRGISPIVTALNPLRDVYENFDYALAKAKVSQLFALAFYRDATEAPGCVDPVNDSAATTDGDGNPVDVPPTPGAQYRVDFGKGPAVLDLTPGDRAEFLESRTPSSEFQAFTQLVVQVALKALSIPYCLFSENFTNYSGSRIALLEYERACQAYRTAQVEMRRNYTIWKLKQWILEDRLRLPSGWTLNDVKFEWVASYGSTSIDPEKEIRAAILSMASGLDTPQRWCRSNGGDFYSNLEALAEAKAKVESLGLSFSDALNFGLKFTNSQGKK
jgi:capsid protein